MLKLTTIGAGSSYTPELCEGLILNHKTFPITHWFLVDIEQGVKKMEIVGNLARRMIEEAGLNIKVVLTTNRRDAIKDADFVSTQFRVGGQDARVKDEMIPLKNGMLGQETNGAAQLFKALRTVPIILDIIKEIKEIAKPNAWLINFTNPSGLVTQAVYSLTDFRNFIGVCNVPVHIKNDVAELINKKQKDIKYDAVGLNHLSYMTNFYYKDKKITKQVIEAKYKSEKDITMKNIQAEEWNPQFEQMTNVILNPYMKYYYKSRTMLDDYVKQAKDNTVRAMEVKEIEKALFKKYEDPDLKEKPEELSLRGGAHYSTIAFGVMNAIYNDTNDEYGVNTLNGGKVPNLPADWVIEVTCAIGKNGAAKTDRDIFAPDWGVGLISSIKAFELQTIKAINNKSLDDAFLALLINPLTTDDVKARKIFDELLAAHSSYLSMYK